jgi:hypothetical protein
LAVWLVSAWADRADIPSASDPAILAKWRRENLSNRTASPAGH